MIVQTTKSTTLEVMKQVEVLVLSFISYRTFQLTEPHTTLNLICKNKEVVINKF